LVKRRKVDPNEFMLFIYNVLGCSILNAS